MSGLYNLARMTTDTVGTGTITLDGAVSSFLSFDRAGVRNNETITYGIDDGDGREIGRGVYNATAKTLTRDVLKSTNDDDPIILSGKAQVSITAAAEDLVTNAGPRGPRGPMGEPSDPPHDGVAYLRRNGVWIPLTVARGTIGADVSHTAANTFFDGPTVDVGREGMWLVSGTVSLTQGASNYHYVAKLWDGTTTIADGSATTYSANYMQSIALSGTITNPAGPLRMSTATMNAAAGYQAWNRWPQIGYVANMNWITAVRIG